MKSSALVLFDFDGTLTTRDTLLAFTQFAVGNARFYAGMLLLSPPLILQKMNIFSAQKAKEMFLRYFFKEISLIEFDKKCALFASVSLPTMLRAGALASIAGYIAKGDRVIIVSASPQNWIIPWANSLGAEVLSSQLEIKNGNLTGRLIGKNCNGIEKVNRIQQHLTLADYGRIIAYGDTSGDKEMLEIAQEQHFKPFRT